MRYDFFTSVHKPKRTTRSELRMYEKLHVTEYSHPLSWTRHHKGIKKPSEVVTGCLRCKDILCFYILSHLG